MKTSQKLYQLVADFTCERLGGDRFTKPVSEDWTNRFQLLTDPRVAGITSLLVIGIMLLPLVYSIDTRFFLVGFVVAIGYFVLPVLSVFLAIQDNERLRGGEDVEPLAIHKRFSAGPVLILPVFVGYALVEGVVNIDLLGINPVIPLIMAFIAPYISIVVYEKSKNTKFESVDESQVYKGEVGGSERLFPSKEAYIEARSEYESGENDSHTES